MVNEISQTEKGKYHIILLLLPSECCLTPCGFRNCEPLLLLLLYLLFLLILENNILWPRVSLESRRCSPLGSFLSTHHYRREPDCCTRGMWVGNLSFICHLLLCGPGKSLDLSKVHPFWWNGDNNTNLLKLFRELSKRPSRNIWV